MVKGYKSNMLNSIVRKIIGTVGVSICSMIYVGGLIHLGFRYLSNADCSISVFFCVFISTFMLLSGCIGIYYVNPTLWNLVHSTKEKGKGSILNLLPDIKSINEFLEYIGSMKE